MTDRETAGVDHPMDCDSCGRNVMHWSRHYTHTETGAIACPECYKEAFDDE